MLIVRSTVLYIRQKGLSGKGWFEGISSAAMILLSGVPVSGGGLELLEEFVVRNEIVR